MKKHRVLALVLVFMMLMTSVAYGAIPNNSVIIGDKGYSIDYLMDEGNLAEINEAVAANGLNPIYFQLDGVADSFTNVMRSLPRRNRLCRPSPKMYRQIPHMIRITEELTIVLTGYHHCWYVLFAGVTAP